MFVHHILIAPGRQQKVVDVLSDHQQSAAGAKSYMKQSQSVRRRTTKTSASVRQQVHEAALRERDQIVSYDNFVSCVEKRCPEFVVRKRADDIALIKLNELGNKVNLFVLFRKAVSPFTFLYVDSVEKEGYEVPKSILKLQKKQCTEQMFRVGCSVRNYFET